MQDRDQEYTLKEVQDEIRRRQNLANRGKKEAPGAFMSGVSGFNEAVGKYPLGILQAIGVSGAEEVGGRRRQEVEENAKEHPLATEIGSFLGEIGATAPIFGAAAEGPLLQRALSQAMKGGLGGGLLGLSEYTEPGENRYVNAVHGGLGGALGGGAAPFIGQGASTAGAVAKKIAGAPVESIKRIMNPGERASKYFYSHIPEEDIQKTLATAQKANRLGLNLTPAEASGSAVQAGVEGNIGNTLQGALTLQTSKNSQKKLQEQAINDFIDSISKEGRSKSFAREAREAAGKSIEERSKKLQERARPYYELAERQTVVDDTWESLNADPIIKRSISSVLKDIEYKQELKGFEKNSIKVLDLAKRNLDDRISSAMREGNMNKARLLSDSKARLIDELDAISPDYAKARRIYSEGSPLVDLLKKGDVGQLSRLSDTQLQSLSSKIFDPAETDMRAFNRVKSAISSQNPQAWNGIVANEMQRRIENAALGSKENAGSNFFNAILSKERTYNQFLHALDDTPKAQETLKDMRDIFKNLLNNYSPKARRGFAETGVEKPRNILNLSHEYLVNLLNGKYDQTAADIITSKKWQDQFLKIMEDKSKPKGQRYESALKFMNFIQEGSPYAAKVETYRLIKDEEE